MNKYVIITGGGSGSRMQSTLPKQFLEINRVPILFYTIAAFYHYNPTIDIIITLPEAHIPYWQKLINEKSFKISHHVIAGGNSRFESVKNGLALVQNGGLVAIHDAVRPFVSSEVIQNAFFEASKHQSAIPIIPIVDSLRRITKTENSVINRNEIFAVQTPQTFTSSAIKEAYLTEESACFTDDATVFEKSNHSLHLISGNTENIKITNPGDISIAETFVNTLLHHPLFPQIRAFERQ